MSICKECIHEKVCEEHKSLCIDNEYNSIMESNGRCDYFQKAEKYKWHDLRENPNDLPKEKERVVFVVPNEQPKKYIGKTIFYSGSLNLDLRQFWNDDYEAYETIGGYDIKDVIKWKYIDDKEVKE